MKNTERFFNEINGFIEDMGEISARYNAELTRLEPFKGSEGYNTLAQQAMDTRNAEVQQMRVTYRGRLNDTLAKMRETLANRPVVPPTQDQVAMLSVLQMRSSIDPDEMERVARQMEGCPMALAVLDDLAAKHKITHAKFNQELDHSWFQTKIATLERKANELLQDVADAATKQKPKDVTECLEKYGTFWPVVHEEYGGITKTETDVVKITAFSAAVDGE